MLMTNDWDFYSLRVDDKPASIFVDLGVASNAPVAGLPQMAYIHLAMAQPTEKGLSSREEYERLIDIEDALENLLVNERTAYVGRCTTNGYRDFYFYLVDAVDWEKRVAAALAPFDEYRYETGYQDDAKWTTYFSFLAPSEHDRQRIENRRVCMALEKTGEKFDEPREIDHLAYFREQEKAEAFAGVLKNRGFTVEAVSAPDSENQHFSVAFKRVDTPSFEAIDDIVLPLFNLAREYEGHYDGWGTTVCA